MQNTKKLGTKSVLLATVLVVALGFAWGVRNLFKPRIHSPRVECTATLRAIDGAIQQWASENKLSGTNRVDFIVIKDFLKGSRMPTCMANGIYTATTVSSPPTCSPTQPRSFTLAAAKTAKTPSAPPRRADSMAV